MNVGIMWLFKLVILFSLGKYLGVELLYLFLIFEEPPSSQADSTALPRAGAGGTKKPLPPPLELFVQTGAQGFQHHREPRVSPTAKGQKGQRRMARRPLAESTKATGNTPVHARTQCFPLSAGHQHA